MKQKLKLLICISILLFLCIKNLHAQQIIVPNKEFFKEVKTLLDKGYTVKFQAKGKSMMPIISDSDCVTIQKSHAVSLYDIVLAEVNPEQYVLHRVIEISDEDIMLMGDGNTYGTEKCKPKDIIARAISLSVAEQEYQLGSSREKQWAMVWNETICERDSLLRSITREQLIREILPLKVRGTDTERLEQFEEDCKYVISKYFSPDFDSNVICVIDSQGLISFNSAISFNSTAIFLFKKMLGKEFDVNDMVNALCSEYEVQYSTAYNDSIKLLREWYRVGLVKKVK